MRRLLLVSVAAALLGAAKLDPIAYESAREDSINHQEVSILALIANPASFDGKRVRVSGFLTLRFEDAGLHLDKAAYDAGIRKNALCVEPPKWMDRQTRARITDRYATVYATFEDGHLKNYDLNHVYSGCLEDVRRVNPNFTSADWQDYLARARNAYFLQRMPRALLLTLVIAAITTLIVRLTLRRQRKT